MPPTPLVGPSPAAGLAGSLDLLQQLGAVHKQRLTRLGAAMARLPLEPRLARFLLGSPNPQGARAAAWLARGGDGLKPDLESYLLSKSPSLPEERQLRATTQFAQSNLEAALLAAFPDRVAQVRRGQDPGALRRNGLPPFAAAHARGPMVAGPESGAGRRAQGSP